MTLVGDQDKFIHMFVADLPYLELGSNMAGYFAMIDFRNVYRLLGVGYLLTLDFWC
jgi:hypothetical protein